MARHPSTHTRSTIPVAQNRRATMFVVLIQFFQLFILPLWLLPMHWGWGLLILPLIVISNTQWSLIHEAIHKIYHPESVVNEFAGRGLSILLGVSFHVVRLGHLMHHRYNRNWESEMYDPAASSWLRRAPGYYFHLLGGLYLVEVATSFLIGLLPAHALQTILAWKAKQPHFASLEGVERAASQFLFGRGRLSMIQADAMMILLVHGLSAWLYAPYLAWFALLVGGRALAISFHDNIYHYGTPADNSMPACETYLPRVLSLLILHNNYHHTHHRHPTVPWHMLPKITQAYGFHQTWLQAAINQLRGPVPTLSVRPSFSDYAYGGYPAHRHRPK